MIYSLHVSLGQIDQVYVVPVPGPVTCLVVVAVDGDLFPAPDGDLGDVRHQVLADVLRLVRPRRVEVDEQSHRRGWIIDLISETETIKYKLLTT